MNRLELWFTKLQFGQATRLRLYRKIARLTENNVDLERALDTLWRFESKDGRKPKAPAAIALRSWYTMVSNGKTLGAAMEGWVPREDVVIIDAGEESGKLVKAFDNACYITESRKRIRGEVMAGCIYPIGLLLGAFALMGFFGTQVFPAFEEVWSRDNWQGIAGQMATMSDFVESGLIPVLMAIFAFFVAVAWSMPRWTGKARLVADRLPPYSIYRLVNGSSFLLAMSAMINAGMSLPSAIEVSMRNTSPWMRERLTRVHFYLKSGQDLGEALYRTNMNFPDNETVNDLRTYASLQDFDQALDKIGRDNIEDTVQRIGAQSKVMKNVGLVLVGIVFIWIAVGLFVLQNQMLVAMQAG